MTFVEEVKVHISLIIPRAFGNMVACISLKLDFRPHIAGLYESIQSDAVSTKWEFY